MQSAADAQLLISLENVSLRLGQTVIFPHTNWAIYRDQTWAVLGPNGSGKSLLMRAICGRLPVAGGRIAYYSPGNDAASSALPHAQIVHVSFEAQQAILRRQSPFYQARWNSFASDDTLSVSEYLSASHVRQVNPFQVMDRAVDPHAFLARRDQVVRRLEIGDLLNKRVIHLSNGETRKLLIASALLREPQLIILDNPFTGLDQAFRTRLREIIRRLVQDGTRVMLVATRPGELPAGITHVLRVRDRTVVEQGPVKEMIRAEQATRTRAPRPRSYVPLSPTPDTALPEPARDVLIHMENVDVVYGQARILDQVTWTLRRGENWAVLGPNGSGKTTLLSLISGDNPQSYRNHISLFGIPRGSGESIWEIKRRIGWLSPELHLYYPRDRPCLDVICSGFFDSLGLYQRCTPEQTREAEDWMQSLGIGRHAHRPLGHISQGEQRLVLLARALVKHPQLLILDEPCQGLDASNRERVLRTIDSLGKRPDRSMIYVTHDPDELPATITHVLRLKAGRVESQGRVRLQARSADPPPAR